MLIIVVHNPVVLDLKVLSVMKLLNSRLILGHQDLRACTAERFYKFSYNCCGDGKTDSYPNYDDCLLAA